MSEERRPVWPWIVALLIGMPVLYVASFGPAVWLTARERADPGVVSRLYWPILWQLVNGPHWPNGILKQYGAIGVPHGKTALLAAVDETTSSGVVFVLFREP